MTLSGTQGDHLRVLLQYAHDAIGDVEHLVKRGRCSDLVHAQETLEEYGHLIAAEERWVPSEVLARQPSYKAFYELIGVLGGKLQDCGRVSRHSAQELSGDDPSDRLKQIVEGRASYEVTFPDGTVRYMTWEELHVDLRRSDPILWRQVRYRPLYSEDGMNGLTATKLPRWMR